MTPTFPRIRISPIIPVRRSDVFDQADWVYELKYDGFRALAYVDEGRCRLVSRKGNELKRFDDLCRSIPAEVKTSNAVIDGEVVALAHRECLRSMIGLDDFTPRPIGAILRCVRLELTQFPAVSLLHPQIITAGQTSCKRQNYSPFYGFTGGLSEPLTADQMVRADRA